MMMSMPLSIIVAAAAVVTVIVLIAVWAMRR